MRRRIAAMIANNPDLTELSPLLPRELGVDVVWAGYGTNWPDTLARLAVRDFLDLITLAFRLLLQKRQTGLRDARAPERWVAEVRRVFNEQNFAYSPREPDVPAAGKLPLIEGCRSLDRADGVWR